MKKSLFATLTLSVAISLMVACGESSSEKEHKSTTATPATSPAKEPANTSSYDPKRGEGKFDESNVKLGALNAAMAAKGKTTAETKCFSCHKTSAEKLVGPGWKGVTERKTPHWIMNFITNPDPMIDKDPEVQAQLEICLVRMPNQNLTEEEARNILEFMRKNDGAK